MSWKLIAAGLGAIGVGTGLYLYTRKGASTMTPETTSQGPMPAGKAWCARYPTSRSIDDLEPSWRPKVAAFIKALRAAGITAIIAATRRPKERAWLMHWAWMISREGFNPAAVPPMPGVDIEWTKAGADEMVAGYGLAYQPAIASRHIDGLAVDMNITVPKTVVMTDGQGRTVQIQAGDGDADDDVISVGASYGVIKLRADHPHWSNDGH